MHSCAHFFGEICCLRGKRRSAPASQLAYKAVDRAESKGSRRRVTFSQLLWAANNARLISTYSCEESLSAA